MFYTLAQAAKASGLGAPAIRTAIERGQIAAIRDLFDEWQVEDSELHRLYFPVGPTAAKRSGAATAILPSAAAPEGRIGVQQLREAGDTLQDGCKEVGPAPAELNGDRVIQGTSPEQAGAILCSPAGAENHRTDLERVPVVLKDAPAPLSEPSGTDRPSNEDAQLRFSALDHLDRIAIGNALFWESEIRIDARQEALDSAIRPLANGRHAIIFTAALLTAFVIGWIGGIGSYYLFLRSSPVPVAHESRSYPAAPASANPTAAENERRSGSGALVTGKVASAARRRASSQTMPQGPESRTSKSAAIARQNSTETASDDAWEPLAGAVQGTNNFPRRVPVPETKPTTVEGWTVRSVYNGMAVLEGPGGVWTAARGDTVPGLGRVDSIVLWGSRWIIATTRGLVTTP